MFSIFYFHLLKRETNWSEICIINSFFMIKFIVLLCWASTMIIHGCLFYARENCCQVKWTSASRSLFLAKFKPAIHSSDYYFKKSHATYIIVSIFNINLTTWYALVLFTYVCINPLPNSFMPRIIFFHLTDNNKKLRNSKNDLSEWTFWFVRELSCTVWYSILRD